MMRVLWISRHLLDERQLAGLKRFCGGTVDLRCWKDNVEDPAALADAVADADVIAAVLPIHLLAGLMELAGDRPVLVPVARRTLIPSADGEPVVRFAHGGWQRIRRLEMELEMVDG